MIHESPHRDCPVCDGDAPTIYATVRACGPGGREHATVTVTASAAADDPDTAIARAHQAAVRVLCDRWDDDWDDETDPGSAA